MAKCRVGMSSDPTLARVHYWMQKEGHKNYRILVRNLTYDEAQVSEAFYATRLGCRRGGGGDPSDKRDEKVWFVYRVYTQKKTKTRKMR